MVYRNVARDTQCVEHRLSSPLPIFPVSKPQDDFFLPVTDGGQQKPNIVNNTSYIKMGNSPHS